MPLRYLVDENLRGPFWAALVRANTQRGVPVTIKCVGEYGPPPLSSKDPDILIWAEREGYVVISNDMRTLPAQLAAHIRAGRHLPGLFLIELPCSIPALLEALFYYATESADDDWRDQS